MIQNQTGIGQQGIPATVTHTAHQMLMISICATTQLLLSMSDF